MDTTTSEALATLKANLESGEIVKAESVQRSLLGNAIFSNTASSSEKKEILLRLHQLIQKLIQSRCDFSKIEALYALAKKHLFGMPPLFQAQFYLAEGNNYLEALQHPKAAQAYTYGLWITEEASAAGEFEAVSAALYQGLHQVEAVALAHLYMDFEKQELEREEKEAVSAETKGQPIKNSDAINDLLTMLTEVKTRFSLDTAEAIYKELLTHLKSVDEIRLTALQVSALTQAISELKELIKPSKALYTRLNVFQTELLTKPAFNRLLRLFVRLTPWLDFLCQHQQFTSLQTLYHKLEETRLLTRFSEQLANVLKWRAADAERFTMLVNTLKPIEAHWFRYRHHPAACKAAQNFESAVGEHAPQTFSREEAAWFLKRQLKTQKPDELPIQEERKLEEKIPLPSRPLLMARRELAASLEKEMLKHIAKHQTHYTQAVMDILKNIFAKSVDILGPPPTDFCVLGLGSLSRGELCPASDVEIAFLVADSASRQSAYFQFLRKIVEQKIACLGEHPELGLHLDTSFTAHLDNRADVPMHIDTPTGMAASYAPSKVNVEQSEPYALYRAIPLYQYNGNKQLFTAYREAMQNLLGLSENKSATEKEERQKLALNYLAQHAKEQKGKTHLKERYLAPLIYACMDLALYFGLADDQNILLNSLPAIIQQLSLQKVFDPEAAKQLTDTWSELQYERILTHLEWIKQRWQKLPDPSSEIRELRATRDQTKLEQIEQLILKPLYLALLKWLAQPVEPLDPILYLAKENLKSSTLNDVIALFSYRQTPALVQSRFYQTLPDRFKNHYYQTTAQHEAKQLSTKLNTLVADYAEIPLDSLREPLTTCWQGQSGSHSTLHLLQALGSCPLEDGSRPYYTESVQTWQETLKALIEPLSTEDKQNEKRPDRWLLQWIDSNGRIVTGILKQAIQTNWREQGYLDEKANLITKEKWPKEKHEGRSRVMRVMIGDVTVAYGKCYPELPGVQVLAESLAWRLSGVGPLSTLVTCTNAITGERYPILFSQNAGETLQAIFEKEGSLSRIEKTLDPYSFTWKFFETLLLLYEDDKLDNQALQFFYNRQGEYRSRLISFDSDRAFVKPVLDEKNIFGRTLKVNAKSIVFCLPQMKELLNEDAVREMINLDPETLLKGWLNLAAKHNGAFGKNGLFHLAELQKWAKQAADSSHLPELLLPNTVKRLYQTFRRMQRALKENSKQTHFELFRSIEPFLASFYEEAFENPEGTSTTKRFKHLPTEYVILESEIKETKQESTAGDEKKTIVSRKLKSVQVQSDQFKRERSFRTITTVDGHEIQTIKKAIQQILKNEMSATFRQQNYELKPALHELKTIHQHYHQISHLRAELLQGKTKNFKALRESDYLKERIVDHIFLKIKPRLSLTTENLEKLILEAMATGSYQELYFTGCHTLTDKILLPILQSSPNLRILDVSGCTLLTDNTVINVAYYCPRLEKLSLSGLTQLKKLTRFKVIGYGSLHFPKLKRLLLDNCSDLTHLAILAPQLETISICNNNLLNFINIQEMDKTKAPKWSPKQILEECLAAAQKEFIPYLEQQRGLLPFLINRATKKNLILTRKSFLDDLINRWLTSRISLLGQETKLERSPADVEDAFWQAAEALAWNQLTEEKVSSGFIKGIDDIKTESKDIPKNNFSSSLREVEQDALLQPLLKRSNNQFFHPVLQHYFVVCYLFRVFKGGMDFTRKPISSPAISSIELPIIEWLSELLFNDVTLETQLFAIIEKSRTDAFAPPFAAYAITLLNYCNIPLVEMDFRHIRISGADLRGALLQGTCFGGADLREVNFTNAYLRETDFRSAQLSNHFISTISLPSSQVEACCYSPDGRYLAVASGEVIYLYEARTGIRLGVLEGHTRLVTSVVFHPDGSQIISGSWDHTLRLWDVVECKTLHIFEGHTDYVTSVNFHPDGSRIVSGSWDKTVRLWDAVEHKDVHTFKGHTNLVTSVVFHPDGSCIASGSMDNTLRLWDVAERKLLHTFEGHTDHVKSVVFHPDGSRIVSGSWDKTVRLWDVVERKTLYTFKGHTHDVTSVAFHPDGSCIVSGSGDNTLRLWDALEGKALHTFKGHTRRVTNVAFQPDGSRIVSGSWDKTVRLWDVVERKALHTFERHTYSVMSVAFHPDGSCIVSGSRDGTLRLWDPLERKALHTFEGHTDWVTSVAFHPNGSRIVSGSRDGTLRLWGVLERKTLHTFREYTHWVSSVAFSPDGSHILSGSRDGTLHLWDAFERKALHTFEGHTHEVTSVAFSPDGSRILSGSRDGTLHLWDAFERKALHTFEGYTHWVSSVAFSPDASRIVSGSGDCTLRLWDVLERKALHTFKGHTSPVNSVAFNPKGACLASGSDDQTVRLWSTRTYECLAVIKGFTGSVNSVAWAQTPQGLLLASGSSDHAVRYWRITLTPKNAQAALLFSSHPNQVLNTENMLIYGAKGLDEETIKFLKQHGAIDGPPLKSKTASQAKGDSNPSLENKNNVSTASRLSVFARQPVADVAPGDEKKNDPRSIHYQRKS